MISIPASDIAALERATKKKLDALSIRKRRRILRTAAAPMVAAARKNVDDAPAPVKRYSTAKVFSGKRAPKGSGTVAATYYPGNLKKSIRTMTFRKSRDAVFIGPKAWKKTSGGDFGKDDNRVDPYYAHMVHDGTSTSQANPYMLRAFESTKSVARNILERELKRTIEKS